MGESRAENGKKASVDEEWHAIKTTLRDKAMETLFKQDRCSKEEWLSQETLKLAAESRQLT